MWCGTDKSKVKAGRSQKHAQVEQTIDLDYGYLTDSLIADADSTHSTPFHSSGLKTMERQSHSQYQIRNNDRQCHVKTLQDVAS